MDIAVKRGFAIGFVVLAGLAVGYGCQPQIERALQTLRDGDKPDTLAGPVTPQPSEPVSPGSKAPGPEAPALGRGSPQAATPAPAPDALQQPTPDRTAPNQNPATGLDPSRGGAFDIVRVEPSGEMVVAGRCAANCTAELTANGKTYDAAKADAQGQFAMTPAPLPPGDYQIGLRTRTPDGGQQTSTQTLTVAIPAPPSTDVVVVLNAPDAPSRILQQPAQQALAGQSNEPGVERGASSAPAMPTGEPQTATLGAVGTNVIAPLAIGAVEAENGRVFAQGTGPAGASLRLYLNNAPLTTATIGADGRWSLRVEQGLTAGAYSVRADQLDPAGAEVIGRVETRFTYAPELAATETTPADPPAASQPSAPDAPASAEDTPAAPSAANAVVASIDTAQVRRGDSLWRISRTTYGRGVRYTEIYQANGGQIRDPDLIYPGQVFVLPTDQIREPLRPARP